MNNQIYTSIFYFILLKKFPTAKFLRNTEISQSCIAGERDTYRMGRILRMCSCSET